jgi:sigma-B regulation protein RsbU (phosphoserine phosphatase)
MSALAYAVAGYPLPVTGNRQPVTVDSIDVHAISKPARTFTGDFWFTHRTHDRLWFAIGDVAGKGLPAALVMAMIQEELEHRIASCARTGCDPATTVERLHTFLRPLLPRNRFATMVIGWLREDGALRLVNAGHCPPLIVRNDGRLDPIPSTGPIVGVLKDPRWQSVTLTLGSSEHLLLYTDGVTEAEKGDEEFGRHGIERALRTSPRGSARTLAANVLDAVERHAGGMRSDDLTVLAVMRV